MNLNDHCIFTGSDGVLDGTTEQNVKDLVNKLRHQDKIVIHLHGGLVNVSKAKAKAKELSPEYRTAGAYPVFFIYRTGLLATIRGNLHEIEDEKIFERLFKKVLKYVWGKLTQSTGTKATGTLNLPKDLEVDIAYKKIGGNKELFTDIIMEKDLKKLTKTEMAMFKDELKKDTEIQKEILAIVNWATGDQKKQKPGAKGVKTKSEPYSKMLMSDDVLQKLINNVNRQKAKGIILPAIPPFFIWSAVKILARVVSRRIKKRDHGVHATIVEEILREFYIAHIGAAIYGMMKKETSDTFDPPLPGEIRGGRYFVEQFGKMLEDTGHKPEVSVVAHSLGSVFACNLIRHLAESRKNKSHPLPQEFKLKNLIFLAPAVEFEEFADILNNHRGLFDHFRMFTLEDEKESGYWEVKGVYPCSLLYLVSGVFEKQKNGKSAFDRPLVGMERYYKKKTVYKQADVIRVRNFINPGSKRVIWAVDDQGPGLASDAECHTGFDDAIFKQGQEPLRKTIDSILHILREGI